MATVQIINQPIWPLLFEHIEFLRTQRKTLSRSEKRSRMGINLSIILTTACVIEGKLESDLKTLIEHRKHVLREIEAKDFYHRRIYNTFINNVEDHLTNQVERVTGIDNFESFFDLLSYKRMPSKYNEYPNWEGVKVLFNFRNVLAHGREVTAQRISAWWLEVDWKDDFSGGYKITENYLLKKKLITKRFIEEDSIDHFFTNKIADHFYSISKGFLRYHSKIVAQEKRKFTFANIEGI